MTVRRIRIAGFMIASILSASAFALSQSQPSGFVQILPDKIKWMQGPALLVAFAPGSAFVVPANASHFHWMKSGASVVQISGVGPTRTEYIPYDDPIKD